MDSLQEVEIKLWEYIDGFSTETEKDSIEKLIRENAEWRAKYEELLSVHQFMSLSELEEPSMRFTKNVMDEIDKYHIAPAAKEYINKKIIWGIAAFFITVIVSFIIYGISQIDWSTGNTANELGVDFSKIDYSSMFNNVYLNFFMMANVVLGLLLFDRYLENKKREFQKQF